MEITEVRIKLMEEAGERLQAFCSITFDDCFVIRDLKIIEGSNGPFVAMPSRKLTAHCPQCGCKNHLRANFCNQCGLRLSHEHAPKDDEGRAKLYADIAHPINSSCREMIQERVIREFYEEQERAKQPGYVSRYDDVDFDEPPRPHAKQGFRRGGGAPRPSSEGAVRGPHTPPQRGPNRGTYHAPASKTPAAPLAADAKPPGDQKPVETPADGTPKSQDSFGAGIF